MSSNQQKSLGNRLGNIANKHRGLKKWRTTVIQQLNKEREQRPPMSEPVYSMGTWSSNPTAPKKNCGPKPPQFIGTKKNPAYNDWKKCSSPAAGGKRKTRRSKKSKKSTRRRR